VTGEFPYREAASLYAEGRTEEAARLIDSEISKTPDSIDGMHLRLIRARALESGEYLGGRDLERAYEDYCQLHVRNFELRTQALVGSARVLFKIDVFANAREIQRLLESALEVEPDPHAHMLMGALFDEAFQEPSRARAHYLAAFRLGLPWGLRYFAASHIKSKNYLRGAFFHLLATLVSPILVIRKSARGPFEDKPPF
jgi:hypothetical protein